MRRELTVPKMQTNQDIHRNICWIMKERKEMYPRRRSFNKNDAKKPFIANASDNHVSETAVTGVCTPICSHILWSHVLQLSVYAQESQKLSLELRRSDEWWQVNQKVFPIWRPHWIRPNPGKLPMYICLDRSSELI